jgi:hypothetical protein
MSTPDIAELTRLVVERARQDETFRQLLMGALAGLGPAAEREVGGNATPPQPVSATSSQDDPDLTIGHGKM